MPNRVIKETINESLGLSECTVFADDLYKRLITYADDYGRFNSDTTIMRARLYPREYECITEEDIINGLAELAGVGKIEFYTATHFNQGKQSKGVYGVFPNWSVHQRIRDSKAKCPDPDDTDINDWYLRRFVPLDMKAEIIERDGFKCKICGKFLTSCRDPKRFAKLGNGLYHIDHIVPLLQGGRATLENLRLTCPECNLKRKKRFTFRELLEEGLRQVAAGCGESRPESNPNPIQSESISESEHIDQPPSGGERIDYAGIVASYNRICVSLPHVRDLTDQRRRAIKGAVKQVERAGGFECLFRRVEASDFLSGRAGSWQAGFDWILRPANLTKVLEGNYDNRKSSKSKGAIQIDGSSLDLEDYEEKIRDYVPVYRDEGGST